jgi:hypothetical protein
MECSSGLDRRLSEFGLFLIESRLDLLLSTGSTSIVGIGHVSLAKSMTKVRRSSQDVFNKLEKAFMDWQSAEAKSLNIWNKLFGKEHSRPLQRVLEEVQFVTMVREPLSYKIVLAETLAYKSDERVEKKIDIIATDKKDHQSSTSIDWVTEGDTFRGRRCRSCVKRTGTNMSFAKVIQLSDFHFGQKLTQQGRAFYQEAFLFAKAKPHSYYKLQSLALKLHQIRTQKGDFDVALATGDLSTDGSETALRLCMSFVGPRWVEDEMRPETRGLALGTKQTILIPGNHDRFDRAWIGFQKATAAFEKILKTPTPYPYVVGYRRLGVPNVPDNPAILFFVFASTPSKYARMKPWHKIARGRLSDGDCGTFYEKAEKVQDTGRVAALHGAELNVRYENCVRVAVLHHHPFDNSRTTLMDGSEKFTLQCLNTGMHLVLFGHDHKEFWEKASGASMSMDDQNHVTLFLCCPSASECASKCGFYTFEFDTAGFVFDFYKFDDRTKAFAPASLDRELFARKGYEIPRVRFNSPLQ